MFENWMNEYMSKRGYEVKRVHPPDQPVRRVLLGAVAGAAVAYCLTPKATPSLVRAVSELAPYLTNIIMAHKAREVPPASPRPEQTWMPRPEPAAGEQQGTLTDEQLKNMPEGCCGWKYVTPNLRVQRVGLASGSDRVGEFGHIEFVLVIRDITTGADMVLPVSALGRLMEAANGPSSHADEPDVSGEPDAADEPAPEPF